MFLAVSWGGVMLARAASRRSRRVVVASLTAVTIVAAATYTAKANMAPLPNWFRWAGLSKALSDGKPTNGDLEIQIVPDGNDLTLVVPQMGKPLVIPQGKPAPAQQ
jgi:hypothetical protein